MQIWKKILLSILLLFPTLLNFKVTIGQQFENYPNTTNLLKIFQKTIFLIINICNTLPKPAENCQILD